MTMALDAPFEISLAPSSQWRSSLGRRRSSRPVTLVINFHKTIQVNTLTQSPVILFVRGPWLLVFNVLVVFLIFLLSIGFHIESRHVVHKKIKTERNFQLKWMLSGWERHECAWVSDWARRENVILHPSIRFVCLPASANDPHQCCSWNHWLGRHHDHLLRNALIDYNSLCRHISHTKKWNVKWITNPTVFLG